MLSDPTMHLCCSRSSCLSLTVRSLNSSIPVQASNTLPTNQLLIPPPILINLGLLPLQTRHHWSGPSSSNPQTFLQKSTLPPQPADRLPSQITWTRISISPVSYKRPRPPRARRKSRQVSVVSSNLMAAERGLSIAASRQTC